ncbi:MAG TPA: hypothetical protein VN372_03340 [Methanospirillum sp.]|nr:hypothetical protein [Methanospirillum sp.]
MLSPDIFSALTDFDKRFLGLMLYDQYITGNKSFDSPLFTNFSTILSIRLGSDAQAAIVAGNLLELFRESGVTNGGLDRTIGWITLLVDKDYTVAEEIFNKIIISIPFDKDALSGLIIIAVATHNVHLFHSAAPLLTSSEEGIIHPLITFYETLFGSDESGDGVHGVIVSSLTELCQEYGGPYTQLKDQFALPDDLELLYIRHLVIRGNLRTADDFIAALYQREGSLSSRYLYYLAWIGLCTGSDKVFEILESRWDEYSVDLPWYLRCILLDLDQVRAGTLGISYIAYPDERCEVKRAFKKRRSLAWNSTYFAPYHELFQPFGLYEDRIELYRTELGYLYVDDEYERYLCLLSHSLFKMLPKWDQDLWVGLTLIRSGDPDAAITRLKRASKMGYSRASYVLGKLFLQKGDLSKPSKSISRAIFG